MPGNRDEKPGPADPWAVDAADFPAAGTPTQQLRFLLNYAVLAPSGHNSQPWLFDLGDGRVDVLADRSRRLPVVDPDDRELTISCAVAAETLVLAARQFGLTLGLAPFPEGPRSDLVARLEVTGNSTVPPSFAVLDAIRFRRTTRKAFDPDPLPDDLRAACAAAAKDAGVSVVFAGDETTHHDIAELVAEGDRRQFDDPAFRGELAHWIRPRASPGRDGMSGAAFGMPDALSGVGAFMIRTFDIGGMAASGDERKILEGSPVFMVLATPDDDPSDWVATGRALADALVTLSAEGWTASYLNQPIEIPELRPRLKEALGIEAHPQLLLRVGRADLPEPAARRPVDDVLVS